VVAALASVGCRAELCLTFPRCNSHGLCMMTDQGLEAVARRIGEGGVAAVVIAETDLYRELRRRWPMRSLGGRAVIVLDHLHNRTTERADALLPAATFAEGAGAWSTMRAGLSASSESWRHPGR